VAKSNVLDLPSVEQTVPGLLEMQERAGARSIAQNLILALKEKNNGVWLSLL
jgi:hypothetical protein